MWRTQPTMLTSVRGATLTAPCSSARRTPSTARHVRTPISCHGAPERPAEERVGARLACTRREAGAAAVAAAVGAMVITPASPALAAGACVAPPLLSLSTSASVTQGSAAVVRGSSDPSRRCHGFPISARGFLRRSAHRRSSVMDRACGSLAPHRFKKPQTSSRKKIPLEDYTAQPSFEWKGQPHDGLMIYELAEGNGKALTKGATAVVRPQIAIVTRGTQYAPASIGSREEGQTLSGRYCCDLRHGVAAWGLVTHPALWCIAGRVRRLGPGSSHARRQETPSQVK
jgi:hypothetical protein